MEWLEHAAYLTVVLSFIGGICGAIFNYVVIHPLTSSIKALGESVNELRSDLKYSNTRLNKLEGAVERIEKAVVTAHSRIDKILQEGDGSHDLGHR